ncbi:MAG: aldose 1-epimerase family protein [Clostridia bacterium]|nr:aldose 1-epimerase family protein [Clostridia bacterium]
MNYTIKNNSYTATVSSVGAELISLVSNKDGRELIWQSPSDKYWSKHAPLLFPVAGRLKDSKYTAGGVEYSMSAHGFISKKTFVLKEESDSTLTLVCCADEDTLSVYPFKFRLEVTYTLTESGIDASVTVRNEGDRLMPYTFGWHPGFALPTEDGQDIEDYRLRFADEVRSAKWTPLQHVCFARPYAEDYPLKDGEYVLSESEIYANDTMIFDSVGNSLTLYAVGHPYSLNLSWSDNCPYLCVWKEPANGAKFICLEPWSGLPGDGETDENFDTRAMKRLSPDESESFLLSMSFTV